MQTPTQLDQEDNDWLDNTIAYLRHRPYIWVPAAIIVLVVAYAGFQRLYTTQPIDTDPTVAGQPLSNPDQHVHTLAINPMQPGIIYLGSHYGLFTSTNDGHTWPQKRGILNTLMITALSASHIDPQTIGLVGIEPTGGNFGQDGIYITHDGGATWNRAHDPSGLPAETYRYALYPMTSSNHDWLAIYVGKGVYMSHDDAQTWQLVRAPASNQEAQTVLWNSVTTPAVMLVGSNLNLQLSQDSGKSWHSVDSIPGGVKDIEASSADSKTVYVAADDGVYRSQDGGITFMKVSIPVSTAAFTNLATSLQHPNVVYGLTGQEVWQSTDGGYTWNQQTMLSTKSPRSIYVAQDNDKHVYIGFYSPAIIASSSDSGVTWSVIAK